MKLKKFLAVLLASVMVMGMSVTTFAANATTQISVSGLAETGTNSIEYLQILVPDATNESGYDFADGVTIQGFTSAKDFINADVEAQKAALEAEGTVLPDKITGTITGTTFSATVEAGYYAIWATNTTDDAEREVVYTNPMIVSVEYDKAAKTEAGYEYNVKTDGDESVVAKYTSLPTVKTGEDKTEGSEDDVVEIGGTATYTIETYVPSGTLEYYKIIDKLTDASYNQDTVKVEIQGLGDITSQLNGKIIFTTEGVEDADQQMVIDLTDFLENNAGKKVTITYDVTVTGTKVENNVIPDDGVHDYEEDTEELYTGAIEFTKYGEDEDENGEPDVLADAVFNVKDSNDTVLKFTLKDGIYYLDPEGEEDITTNQQGKFLLYGLNLGTYTVVEVEAPNDYSVNTEEKNVEVKEENTTKYEILDPAVV